MSGVLTCETCGRETPWPYRCDRHLPSPQPVHPSSPPAQPNAESAAGQRLPTEYRALTEARQRGEALLYVPTGELPGRLSDVLQDRLSTLEAEAQALRERCEALADALPEALRVLGIARDRAVSLGDTVVNLGGADMNRGQFLALVEATETRLRAALSGGGGPSK